MVPYVVTNNSINLTLQGKMYVCEKSHTNFDAIKNGLLGGEITEEQLLVLVDVRKTIEKFSLGRVIVENDVLTYDGRELNNCFTKRIIAMLQEGFGVAPLIKFLDNLMENPSARAVNEFYGFLERNELPLTDDGEFLAYKKVRHDFKDIYSGTMDNSIGKIVKMARNAVDDEKNNTCSYGLHFASFDYMSSYGSNDIDDHVVVVKINPRDVVAFPSDYNGAKGRCCQYLVVSEIERNKEIKSHFITEDNYGKVLKVLGFIKTLHPKVKYDSNLSSEGLNNFAIRKLIDDVKSFYKIPVDFVCESLEYVSVPGLIGYVLAETE